MLPIRYAALALFFLAGGAEAATEPQNAVGFENGAVLIGYSSEYGGRDSSVWIALALIDGDPAIGWSSAQNAPFPQDFLFELPVGYEISSLAFDTRQTEEAGYPGISAGEVAVSASTQGPENGFSEIYRGALVPGELNEIMLDAPAAARWLKLSILGNGGYAGYTELMEFSAYGLASGEPPPSKPLSAAYATNWGNFFLIVEDGALRGCYDHDNGRFDGFASGGFLRIQWREDGDQSGRAVLAIAGDGSFINGLWYEFGARRGTWYGPRAEDAARPACAEDLLGAAKSPLEQALDRSGEAVLYGIYFAFDSDVIEPRSEAALNQLLRWLQANPGSELLIEGHTDSDGTETYNLDLSARRAAAVAAWLVAAGIDGARLYSKGLGEARPVAENATAQGRALNRRVEVRVR